MGQPEASHRDHIDFSGRLTQRQQLHARHFPRHGGRGTTSARREHSGILIQSKETSLLLDCGAAAARFLLHKKIEPDVPEILWISHMHSDHNGQVSSLIQSLWLRTRRAPLHVFGPAEVMSAMKEWMEKCLLFPELIGFPIHWHAVKPGRPWVHGPFTLTAFATQHLASLASHFKRAYPKTCFECYGLLIQYEGRRYVYSADLAHPVELAPALKDGKVAALLCELTPLPRAGSYFRKWLNILYSRYG